MPSDPSGRATLRREVREWCQFGSTGVCAGQRALGRCDGHHSRGVNRCHREVDDLVAVGEIDACNTRGTDTLRTHRCDGEVENLRPCRDKNRVVSFGNFSTANDSVCIVEVDDREFRLCGEGGRIDSLDDTVGGPNGNRLSRHVDNGHDVFAWL
jgi:hypothetical protein